MNTIIIEKDIFRSLKDFFSGRSYSRTVVIADENTYDKCYQRLNLSAYLPSHTVIKIKSGESEKTLRTCELIWQEMTSLELDRKALVINLGGGVIGDMGGFCASTYKRGIDFIQIPTTLLAMVDASVGGKLGVDFNGFKNHIGVFCVPKAVLISTRFLETLPENELRSGFAEVIKHCLIADRDKWKELQGKDWKQADLEDFVKHSIKIKDQITSEDPTEKGRRKILNFGHTIGHAIETYYLDSDKRLLHGEAIAIGIICESFISAENGLIKDIELEEIKNYILGIYPKTTIEKQAYNKIKENSRQDKKNEFDKVQAALIGPPGNCHFNINITAAQLEKSLDYYNSL